MGDINTNARVNAVFMLHANRQQTKARNNGYKIARNEK